ADVDDSVTEESRRSEGLGQTSRMNAKAAKAAKEYCVSLRPLRPLRSTASVSRTCAKQQKPGEVGMAQRRARSVVALVFFTCASAAFAQTRGITAEDYFAFDALSDPRFSPDGLTISFVVTTVDQTQNRR